MKVADKGIQELQLVYPSATVRTDGVLDLVFIPKLPIAIGETVRHVDALLCPQEHSGYRTRLFLADPILERPVINGKNANWSSHALLGRNWHSWSWQGVESNQPLLSMLVSHLAAFR